MSKLKEIAKKIILKEKATSASYVNYLNSIGAKIDSTVWFVAPSKTLIDITRPYLLEIGKNVVITEDVKILTHGFDWSVLKIKYGSILGSAGKVSIGNNVFIGTGTIILKGVTIGDNSIIGAGSVVTHDIPANSVSVGNPCIPIYSLSEYKEKREKAQKEELFELIEAYIKAYKKRPNPNDLNEFFYLFEKRTLDQINESFIKKMKYGSEVSFQKSKDVFLNSTPIFDGLDDLVDKCIKERKIILK